MSIKISEAKTQFENHFGAAPAVIVRAPGRVNIIGEHTDYNHGFVLPMAIEGETVILANKRDDRTLNAFAANLEKTAEANLDDRKRNPDNSWIDYVIGVADELVKADKPLVGADLMIIGDVPLGSGLSSSASLEMAALCMFEALGGFELEGPEAPKLGQRVENDFLGLNSGIMDQFISRLGKEGHALFLDCRSHKFDLVEVAFPAAKFVISNTCVPRGLTDSKYNERVAECNEAVTALQAVTKRDGTHLRDFTLEELVSAKHAMSDVVYRRAQHVITEDVRTKAACDAMRRGDVKELGELMDASDFSLRDDYEVTCDELDKMTAIARSLPGCHGSRMTGAGFGGCAISLVATDAIDAFSEALMVEYTKQTGIEGQVFVSAPAEGAGRIA